MWHVIRATVYDPTFSPPRTVRFVTESNKLETVLLELLARLQLEIDGQERNPEPPFEGCLLIGLEVTSTPYFAQAVTRDTEAARTLRRILTSVTASLSSSGSPPADGTKGISSDSSQN